VSELFPHIGGIVDDLAFIHSAQGRSVDHTLSHYEWNTGSIIAGYPSMGSWVTYGLGSENQSLPAFVVIHDPRGGPFTGAAQWSSGFLPAAYQGTVFRAAIGLLIPGPAARGTGSVGSHEPELCRETPGN
jgi:hypothetical protein